MAHDNTRLQMLALVLLGAFAFLSVDLASVQAVMHDYLPLDALESSEPEAAEAPVPTLRTIGRPVLADKSPVERELPCCPGPSAGAEADVHAARVEQVAATMRTPVRAFQLHASLPTLASSWLRPSTGWADLDSAAVDLALTEDQQVSWQRTIEDARRDLCDLRHVPNGDGISWHDVFHTADPGGKPDAETLAARIASFLATELRGGETYPVAETRILSGHRDHLRADLTPEQLPIFDAADVSRLLGSSRPGAARRLAQLRSLHVRLHFARAPKRRA